MVKKVIKKEEVSKINSNKGNVEIKLIENFVSLQRVMTNLSEKFDELSKNISKLLELFELSATALAKKDINFTKPMDEEKIIGKLNNILEQNKTIARGLALMNEGGRESSFPEKMPMPAFKQTPVHGVPPTAKLDERYQKSQFKEF